MLVQCTHTSGSCTWRIKISARELWQNNALALQFWCLFNALTLQVRALDASKSQRACIIILSQLHLQLSKCAVINLWLLSSMTCNSLVLPPPLLTDSPIDFFKQSFRVLPNESKGELVKHGGGKLITMFSMSVIFQLAVGLWCDPTWNAYIHCVQICIHFEGSHIKSLCCTSQLPGCTIATDLL